MTDDRPRSSSEAYYASKEPLTFRSTKEGRKNPKPHGSYKQRMGDTTSSSDKYYAAMDPPEAGSPQPTAPPEKTVQLEAKTGVVSKAIRAFSEGATRIVISGPKDAVRQVQTSVDLAVGRNILKREQADAILFTTENQEATPAPVPQEEPPAEDPPATPEAPEPEVKEESFPAENADHVVEILKENPLEQQQPEPLAGRDATDEEIHEFLHPKAEAEAEEAKPVKKTAKRQRKRTARRAKGQTAKTADKDKPTDKDFAAAFGGTPDDDDSDD